ncbi:divergent PAP2 family protein [Patescibacteria group bacterium]|nr:divergent PAP2 family protein [Patescibacteria group bacterium]
MYKIFLYPIIISLVVHGIKLVIDLIKKRFSWSKAFGYGGMPSSHAALVTSLATVVYLTDGLGLAFAITVILTIIVIRDALGLRGYLSKHAKVLNKLIKDLPDEEEYKYPLLEERIAHTWLQLAIGAVLGIILTILFF